MLTPQVSQVKPITNATLADLTTPPYGRSDVSALLFKQNSDFKIISQRPVFNMSSPPAPEG
jgi:hypothetical protein